MPRYLCCLSFLICLSCSPNSAALPDRLAAPADGKSSININCEHADGVWQLEAGQNVARVEPVMADGAIRSLRLTSEGAPGVARLRWCGSELTLTFHEKHADIDGDGFPDSAELVNEQDRLAFRQWLVRIAQSQFLKLSAAWNPDERDCAGLLRFAWREALRKHDTDWQQRTGLVVDKNLPDVKGLAYPDIPLLGERIFRTGAGPGDFGVFADAETLVHFNMRFLGRNVSLAEEGDVLAFSHVQSGEVIWHLMIVTRPDREGLQLVYHTGGAGGVKLIDLAYLAQSVVFRPVAWNDSFLGVYRLHILE